MICEEAELLRKPSAVTWLLLTRYHCAQADVLGREVMAQLKAAAGDEAYLQALVQAKQHATALRRLRRKQQASEVCEFSSVIHAALQAQLQLIIRIWPSC